MSRKDADCEVSESWHCDDLIQRNIIIQLEPDLVGSTKVFVYFLVNQLICFMQPKMVCLDRIWLNYIELSVDSTKFMVDLTK